MTNSKRIALAFTLAIAATTAWADDKKEIFNPVRTSVTSQGIAPDARAAGLGDVGAATEADVYSQFWNPAKYPFAISRAGVGLSYTPWLRQLVNDIGLAYMSGYYRIGDYAAISAGIRYFSLGEVTTAASSGGPGSAPSISFRLYFMWVDVAYWLMLS